MSSTPLDEHLSEAEPVLPNDVYSKAEKAAIWLCLAFLSLIHISEPTRPY